MRSLAAQETAVEGHDGLFHRDRRVRTPLGDKTEEARSVPAKDFRALRL